MPAGLKGVNPKVAPATISEITNGATNLIGSSSGAANMIKIVVPDSTFRRPALALVAVSLIQYPHCPSTGWPIAHQGLVKKVLLLLLVESMRFTSNHFGNQRVAEVSFTRLLSPLWDSPLLPMKWPATCFFSRVTTATSIWHCRTPTVSSQAHPTTCDLRIFISQGLRNQLTRRGTRSFSLR